ncbi:MAG: SIS domain-containing protein [Candidatus Sumerlaeota bacterium]|nr:SIS domain-containing protein [Candidatus Sumerlaeota bacterium]
MNLADPRQSRFALIREMMETPDVIRRMDWRAPARLSRRVRERGDLLLTGEGSSRIFPARNAIHLVRRSGVRERVWTEGARQAAEQRLDDAMIVGASNSGRTRELIDLLRALRSRGHRDLYGLTASPESLLASMCDETFVLSCGIEQAVAATKSVVEQALFHQILVSELTGGRDWPALLGQLATKTDAVLSRDIDPALAERLARAETVYVAGRDDGVAEEIALKACEIVRKKAVFCEGTYILHGVEEVMTPRDAVLLIDPFEAEWEKYQEVLTRGVGLPVLAICGERSQTACGERSQTACGERSRTTCGERSRTTASRPTPFPTIPIPSMPEFDSYLQLCAGWNLLVAAGLALTLDIDHPRRARKVGNEFVE